MKITIAWWIFPAILFAIALTLFVRSHYKSSGKPKWIEVGPMIFPQTAGLGSYLLGIIFVIFTLVFLAGHYLR